MRLPLDCALTIARAALAEGERLALVPLCVVVLDDGAHPLVVLRDQRASIYRADIATAKAAGCLGLGFGGRELARRAQKGPQFFTALGTLFPKGIVALPGGVLIRNVDGDLIGAVGISGDTADNDELCAVAGIAAAGLIADTGA